MSAGNSVRLVADNQVKLLAAQNTTTQSSSVSIGVGLMVGPQGAGLNVPIAGVGSWGASLSLGQTQIDSDHKSLVAGMTGAAAVATLLRTPTHLLGFVTPAAGAGALATNTSFNNFYFGEDTSVLAASGLGAAFGVAGPALGTAAQRWATPIITNVPRIPLSGPVSIPRTGPRLPNVPAYVGGAVNNTVSNLPSFIALDNGKQPKRVQP